jgi:hypothetical protein
VKERYDSLEVLAHRLRLRAARLIPLIRSSTRPVSAEADRAVAYVTIEAVNAWTAFSRAFFVSSALRAYTAQGTRVTTTLGGMNTVADAILVATRRLNGRFRGSKVKWSDEPKWYVATNLITLIQHVGASNEKAVVGAFGYRTRAFDYLPTLRNFFAHRNGSTCSKCAALAARIPIPHSQRPADILLHRDLAKPMNVLTEWITDMTNVAEQLVQ